MQAYKVTYKEKLDFNAGTCRSPWWRMVDTNSAGFSYCPRDAGSLENNGNVILHLSAFIEFFLFYITTGRSVKIYTMRSNSMFHFVQCDAPLLVRLIRLRISTSEWIT